MKIPADAVMTGHLLVVEYLDTDGKFYLKSETAGTGDQTIPLSKALEFIEYAKVKALAPMIADIVSEHFEYEEVDVDVAKEGDEDDDEYEFDYDDDGSES